MRSAPPRHPDDPKAAPSELEGVITDAAALSPGDRLVYPNQGVCQVVGVEVQEIAGQKLELVRMRREEDGATVMVPKGKVPSVGLRRVASGELVEGVFHYLAAPFDDPELDWKVRHRDNADRLVAGGVLGVAEVVKGLHALARQRPLPTKEREQYDNARHLLVGELAAAAGVAPGLAEDFIDYALMPPAGTTFKLKPPPKPVLLASRPKKRKLVAEEGDGLDDLGLDDLGLDLLGEGGEATAEGGAEGGAEAGAEGAAEGGGEAEGGEAAAGEAEAPTKPAKAPPARKGAKGAAAEEPLPAGMARLLAAVRDMPEEPGPTAKAAPARAKAPPAKPAPKAPAKPAAKPAAKAPAAKAAPRKAPAKPAPKAPAAKAAPKKAPAKKAGGKKK